VRVSRDLNVRKVSGGMDSYKLFDGALQGFIRTSRTLHRYVAELYSEFESRLMATVCHRVYLSVLNRELYGASFYALLILST
jgi:hypothetical protein